MCLLCVMLCGVCVVCVCCGFVGGGVLWVRVWVRVQDACDECVCDLMWQYCFVRVFWFSRLCVYVARQAPVNTHTQP